MPNRRDVGLGWGDRDWQDRDFEGQWSAPRRPNYERTREYERSRNFGRGPDLPYNEFYGRDYGRSPEVSRYDGEDLGSGSYDRDFNRRYAEWHNRWHGASPEEGPGGYYGYRRYGGYGGYGVGGVYGAPWRAERTGPNYFGRGPRGYRRSDERIREEINDRLAYDPDLDASDLDVRVENGLVTLSGVVEDRGAKRLAEDLAEDVMGVDDVNNELKVRHGLWARVTGEHVNEREVAMETQREETTRGTPETTKRPATARSTRSTAR
jgi:osmotically-inducible protein OsmY